MVTVLISVIIPAYDAALILPSCVEAIRRDCLDGVEVLVVDDASTDATGEVAESLGVRVLRLSENGGPGRARNLGAERARGELLFFVDADVMLHPGSIRRVRDWFARKPELAALFGSYDAQPSARGVLTRYRNLLHHYVHQNASPEAATFWSGCGAIRRSLFLAAGGFDVERYPRPSIEDIELGYRLRQAGHTIRLDRDLQCTHMKRWTFGSMLRTDILCRAIPWTRLNLERGQPANDLNIKKSQKVSVCLLALALCCVLMSLLHPGWLLASGGLVLGVLVLNRALYAFFLKQGGGLFLLACIPLHLLYFCYSGLSFLYAWLVFRISGTPEPRPSSHDRS